MSSYLLFILSLILMSISDLIYLKIKNYQLILLGISCLLLAGISKDNIIFFIIFSLGIYILGLLYKDKIGGGDIKVFSILSYLYLSKIFFVMCLSALLGITFCFVFKKKRIPFIPFITFSIFIIEKI